MKHQGICWRLSRSGLGPLSAALKPLRSHEETAKILGLSASAVRQIENSALRKIVRAMTRPGENGEPTP